MLKLEGTKEDITGIFSLKLKLCFGKVFIPELPTEQILIIIKSLAYPPHKHKNSYLKLWSKRKGPEADWWHTLPEHGRPRSTPTSSLELTQNIPLIPWEPSSSMRVTGLNRNTKPRGKGSNQFKWLLLSSPSFPTVTAKCPVIKRYQSLFDKETRRWQDKVLGPILCRSLFCLVRGVKWWQKG